VLRAPVVLLAAIHTILIVIIGMPLWSLKRLRRLLHCPVLVVLLVVCGGSVCVVM
jgi:hypothetical protein